LSIAERKRNYMYRFDEYKMLYFLSFPFASIRSNDLRKLISNRNQNRNV